MKIVVVGTGYVGLVVGACFAETGNEVVCVDKMASKVATLKRGKMPIFEPGLEEIVVRNASEGRLTFSTQLGQAVQKAEVVFIAVGTPMDEDGSADLQHVLSAAREIGKAMRGYTVIVDKSTVPVGTAALVQKAVAAVTSHPFSVVSNPEFLKQGAAVDDFLKPDRVVIGADEQKAADIMVELYRPFTLSGAPIIVMDCASAEMCKYAANAMLATRISFMNEIANVCELYGADVDQVRRAMGTDRRIGQAFLFPGIGYGGSCFPKDVQAMVRFSAAKKYKFGILSAVEAVNRSQKSRLLAKLDKALGKSLKNKTVAVWGLAFKPRTDDMREAPAVPIIEGLLARGARVQAYDPEAMSVARRIFGAKVALARSAYAAVKGADALLIVTEWNEFREPDFDKIRKLMRRPLMLDGRNIYQPGAARAAGFTYESIGRP